MRILSMMGIVFAFIVGSGDSSSLGQTGPMANYDEQIGVMEGPVTADSPADFLNYYLMQGVDVDVPTCNSFYNRTCRKWKPRWESSFHTSEIDEMQSWFWKIVDAVRQDLESLSSQDLLSSTRFPKYAQSTINFYSECIGWNKTDDKDLKKGIFNNMNFFSERPPSYIKGEVEADQQEQKRTAADVWHMIGKFQQQAPLFFYTDVVFSTKACGGNATILAFGSTYQRLFPPSADSMKQLINEAADNLGLQISDEQMLEKSLNDAVSLYNDVARSSPSHEEVTERQSIQLDKDLYLEYMRRRKSESNAYDLLNLNDLMKKTDNPYWPFFFRSLIGDELAKKLETDEERFALDNSTYFLELTNIISKYSYDAVFNYVLYKTYVTYGMDFKVYSNITRWSTKPRENGCAIEAMRLFPAAIARILLDQRQQSLDIDQLWQRLDMMFENIRSTFTNIVNNNAWLNTNSQQMILKKANCIRFYSGIPNWIKNETELNQRTGSFNSKMSFIENKLFLRQEAMRMQLSAWINSNHHMEPEPQFIIDALYRNTSTFVLPTMGIIFSSAFNLVHPLAVNYGSLGWVLAHEFIHAFDYGHFQHFPWPDESLDDGTIDVIQNKATCLKNQLSSYYRYNGRLGYNTSYLDEAIADLDGLKLAYYAYQKALETDETKHQYQGMEVFNTDQTFFIAAARKSCSSIVNNNFDVMDDGMHPPEDARVHFSVSNFEKFAQAFNCPKGSFEAPLITCPIWAE